MANLLMVADTCAINTEPVEIDRGSSLLIPVARFGDASSDAQSANAGDQLPQFSERMGLWGDSNNMPASARLVDFGLRVRMAESGAAGKMLLKAPSDGDTVGVVGYVLGFVYAANASGTDKPTHVQMRWIGLQPLYVESLA